MATLPKIPVSISHVYPFHQQGITGKNVTVAVIDSGFASHPDVTPSRLLTFYDFISHKPTHYDDFSHGTHVTGIIASERIGIAPECNLIPIKILDHNGHGSTDIFIEAIKWILYHHQQYHIRIVNISIGGNSPELKPEKNRLNLWVTRLWEQGLVVCCSAGNNGTTPDAILAPGNCKSVITVGSYDGAQFSSIGYSNSQITKPELSAPGYRILSLKPYGGYCTKNGTSMSVPFISGFSALLLHQYPHLTNNQIKSLLVASATPVPDVPLIIQGSGIVNLQKAFQLAEVLSTHNSPRNLEGSSSLL